MKVQMVSWDFKEGAPIDDIARAVQTASGGRVHLYEVDTGSETCAVVVSDRELTPTQIAEIYEDR